MNFNENKISKDDRDVQDDLSIC